jgi:FdhD protein
MRTPGHDVELVCGLIHAEGIASCALAQIDADAIDVDADASAFAGRGLLASAACGVCGRVAIADLELRAKEVTRDTVIEHDMLAALPDRLRSAQQVFGETGGLHAAGLFTAAGALVVSREDVGRHNAVDKVIGHALTARVQPEILVLSGRGGYELVQKAVMAGVAVIASVSAPSSLAIELAERFGVALAGFVRGDRANIYSHAWRIR